LILQDGADDDTCANIGSLFEESATEKSAAVVMSDYGAAEESDVAGNTAGHCQCWCDSVLVTVIAFALQRHSKQRFCIIVCSAASVTHLHLLEWPLLLPTSRKTESCGVGVHGVCMYMPKAPILPHWQKQLMLLIAMASPCVCRYSAALFVCLQSVCHDKGMRKASYEVSAEREGKASGDANLQSCLHEFFHQEHISWECPGEKQAKKQLSCF